MAAAAARLDAQEGKTESTGVSSSREDQLRTTKMSAKSFVAPGLNVGSRFSKPPVSAEEGKQKGSIGDTRPAWMIAAAERVAQGEEEKKRSANLGRQQHSLESHVGRDDMQESERKTSFIPNCLLRNGPTATATTTCTTPLAAEAKDEAVSVSVSASAGSHAIEKQPAWMVVAAERLAQEEAKENELKMKTDHSQQRRRVVDEPRKTLKTPPAAAALKVGSPSLALLKPSGVSRPPHPDPVVEDSNEDPVLLKSLLAQRKGRDFGGMFSSQTTGETTTTMTMISTALSEPTHKSEEKHSCDLSSANMDCSLESPPPPPRSEEIAKAVALLEDLDQRLVLSDAEVAKRKAAFDARIAATHLRMKASCERAVKHSMAAAALLDGGAAFLTDYTGGLCSSDEDDEDDSGAEDNKKSARVGTATRSTKKAATHGASGARRGYREERDALFSNLERLRRDVADAKEEHRITVTEQHRISTMPARVALLNSPDRT
jgi:hypothetical protein